jgi:alpha-beta hydrolase superfamily lysophospholipase
VLEPPGAPVGVVVLLHGLSDSPYSLRHIADCYRSHGFVAIGMRLPGHGTVPGGLTHVDWEDWMAAVRLVMREAALRAGGDLPVHIVGYSNGGALALKYALDALDDPSLRRPDRIVLISPMIGVPPSARFAGLAGWPAVLPSFAKAAWLTIAPEYNPFKYNSFPINAARQSYRLSTALQAEVAERAGKGELAQLAPVLTFQSVVDSTVVTAAVVSALYAFVPKNGSELVLFDVNRKMDVGPLLRPEARVAATSLLPAPPRNYRVAVVTNADASQEEVVAQVTEANAVQEESRDLGVAYPPQVFSLSHIALPFPVSDGLYGLEPDPGEQFGVHLGTLGVRAERGVLEVGMDALMRITSNPFFPYLIERVEAGIAQPASGQVAEFIPTGH